jgi:hypothetical protein
VLQVGPGSYSVLESPKQPKFATAAAFGTGAQRFALAAPLQSAADEPDQGGTQQQAATAAAPAAAFRPWSTHNNVSSSFASSTKRFVLDKETVAKPG